MFSWFSSSELKEARRCLAIMGDVFSSYGLYSDKVSIFGRYQYPLKLGGRPFIASGFLKVPVDTILPPKAVFREQLIDERLITALRSALGKNVEVVVGDNLVLPSLFSENVKSPGSKSIFGGFSKDIRTYDLWYVIELDSSRLRGIPRVLPFSSVPSPVHNHIISIPLGYTVGEGVRLVDFPSDMISLLVCGATGQGKSVYLRSLVNYVSSHYPSDRVKFVLADFKEAKTDFKMFSGSSFVHLDSPEDIISFIEAENSSRSKLLNSSSCLNIFEYNSLSSSPLPYVMIVIDEFASLIADLELRYSKADLSLWLRRLTRLVSVTRSTGLYWVVGTQRPTVDIISGSLKANLISRIAFSMTTETDVSTVFDADELKKFGVQVGCKGRGFCLYGDSFLEFQAPFWA